MDRKRECTSGNWVRGIPIGTTYNSTPANPDVDATSDCFVEAYITGNYDTVNVSLMMLMAERPFCLPRFLMHQLCLHRIFFIRGGFLMMGYRHSQRFAQYLLTNGTQTVTLETVRENTPGNSSWIDKVFRMEDYITPTATMQLIVRQPMPHPATWWKRALINSRWLTRWCLPV
jgi:hypothetical protein